CPPPSPWRPAITASSSRWPPAANRGTGATSDCSRAPLIAARYRALNGSRLHPNHPGVDAAQGNELVVGAALGDATAVEDEDLVRGADGAHPVRDDEGGPPGHHAAQRGFDLALRLCIDR